MIKKLFMIILMCGFLNSAPIPPPVMTSNGLIFLPASSFVPYYGYPSMIPGQIRGPFDFIGNWIQQSSWFPVEINIPDTISGIGTNFNNFAQSVGTGFNQFTQNVNNGWSNFASQFGNRFRNITQNLPFFQNRPNKYYILVPRDNIKSDNKLNWSPFMDGDEVQFLDFP